MDTTPAPRILTGVPMEEAAIYTDDGRVFYDMQSMVFQWTARIAEAKMQAISEGMSATAHAYIAGQASVLSMILENIDVLLTEAGMSEHAIGMGDFDKMVQHFTSE